MGMFDESWRVFYLRVTQFDVIRSHPLSHVKNKNFLIGDKEMILNSFFLDVRKYLFFNHLLKKKY